MSFQRSSNVCKALSFPGGIGGKAVTEPEIVYLFFAFLKKTHDAQTRQGEEFLHCFASLPIAVLKLEREASWEMPKHFRSYGTIDIRV